MQQKKKNYAWFYLIPVAFLIMVLVFSSIHALRIYLPQRREQDSFARLREEIPSEEPADSPHSYSFVNRYEGVMAQNVLGAARTSAYYAVAPFVGTFFSFAFLREQITWTYIVALIVMLGGSVIVVADTLIRHHAHLHQHVFAHTHDGSTHTHTVTHSHEHDHYLTDTKHGHRHTKEELEKLPGALHARHPVP